MAAATKPRSVLLGFGVCALCGGKSHVKRIDEPGKRPYSHCLDEHDQGCSHTLYTYSEAQAALLMGKTRAPKALAGATATATVDAGGVAATATPTPAATAPEAPAAAQAPTATPAPAKRRHSLFGA